LPADTNAAVNEIAEANEPSLAAEVRRALAQHVEEGTPLSTAAEHDG
jgi:hypothetical protein